jgi:Lon-like ATP-dependent protease
MSNSTSNVFDEPDKLADFAAAVSTGDVDDLQAVLESLSVEDRLQKSLLILKKELINAQLQNKISRDVESKIQKRQREYYLMEQLKGIKKELGMESDGKDKMVERFKEKAAKLAMPEGVRKVFDEEISKLMHLEPAASEFKYVILCLITNETDVQCYSKLPRLVDTGPLGCPLARELQYHPRQSGARRGPLRS